MDEHAKRFELISINTKKNKVKICRTATVAYYVVAKVAELRLEPIGATPEVL